VVLPDVSFGRLAILLPEPVASWDPKSLPVPVHEGLAEALGTERALIESAGKRLHSCGRESWGLVGFVEDAIVESHAVS
jgi:hypothetical protein